jgi:hypothetical protein
MVDMFAMIANNDEKYKTKTYKFAMTAKIYFISSQSKNGRHVSNDCKTIMVDIFAMTAKIYFNRRQTIMVDIFALTAKMYFNRRQTIMVDIFAMTAKIYINR